MYWYVNKYIPLNKEEILKRVTEKEIFSYLFKENIDLYKKYKAPYRDDKNAGCFFSLYNGTLYFVDFADKESHKNCFRLFEKIYNLSYFEVLKEINNIFELGLDFSNKILKEIKYDYSNKSIKTENNKTGSKILCYLRDYEIKDINFWNTFYITKEQLIADKVYPIIAFKVVKEDKTYLINNLEQSYVFSNFDNNKVKIYSPFSKYKWITNCSQNDIGEINSLPEMGNELIITKSYKDCRVLRNLNYNSIWIQNERVIPNNFILENLSKRFKNIYLFFDNDSTGLAHTKIMMEKFKNLNLDINIKSILIPPILLKENIKDISDYIKIKGKKDTINFLKEKVYDN